MSKRTKGLSFDEKRKRLCDIFYETRDFFQLRELEKIAPKQKGIVLQTVKEVLQSLVDDNLVTAEKIGTSNYFWSFPSTALQTRKTKIDALDGECARLASANADAEDAISAAAIGKEPSDERTELLERLRECEETRSALLKELDAFKEMDPDLFEEKKTHVKRAKTAVNRWTDNIFTLQSYCTSKFGMDRADFNAQFGVSEDLDYIAE